VHLTWPAPATFGRTPVLRLPPELAGFASIGMRGAWRIGPVVLAKDPRAWRAAAIPWQVEDFLHVARRIRGEADVVVADGACLTAAFPYALSPAARRIVVVRDRIAGTAAPESTALVDQAGTLRPGAAEAVVAIEGETAAFLQRALPGRPVIAAADIDGLLRFIRTGSAAAQAAPAAAAPRIPAAAG
jgi:hypothetical protein